MQGRMRKNVQIERWTTRPRGLDSQKGATCQAIHMRYQCRPSARLKTCFRPVCSTKYGRTRKDDPRGTKNEEIFAEKEDLLA